MSRLQKMYAWVKRLQRLYAWAKWLQRMYAWVKRLQRLYVWVQRMQRLEDISAGRVWRHGVDNAQNNGPWEVESIMAMASEANHRLQ